MMKYEKYSVVYSADFTSERFEMKSKYKLNDFRLDLQAHAEAKKRFINPKRCTELLIKLLVS